LMGASDQLPSSQILVELRILAAFWTVVSERSYKKMTKDFYACIFKKLQEDNKWSPYVFKKLHAIKFPRKNTHMHTHTFTIYPKLPRDYYLCAFKEIFSIRQCNGKLCGENSMHV
jgi:hypothetical protein